MWGTFLSEPLSIDALVGRYPANKLMERIPIDYRNSLITKRCLLECYGELVPISQCYAPVKGRLHTRYAPVRRSPAIEASFNPDAPRLACVRPAASVHPEPGSNSPLYKIYKCFVRVLTIRLSLKGKLTDKYYISFLSKYNQ